MATINPVIRTIGDGDKSVLRITWTPVTENDSCAPVRLPDYSDKCVQVLGTFGSSTTAVHGSNDDGVTYAALNDPTGTAIAITSAKIKAVLENTEYLKPVITGGTGQSLSIVMVAKLPVRRH